MASPTESGRVLGGTGLKVLCSVAMPLSPWGAQSRPQQRERTTSLHLLAVPLASGFTAGSWPPTTLGATGRHSQGPAAQPLLLPPPSLLSHSMLLHRLHEVILADSVNRLPESRWTMTTALPSPPSPVTSPYNVIMLGKQGFPC